MVIRVVITGKTGSGKSTICNMLYQNDIMPEDNEFPICANLVGTTFACKSVKKDNFEIVDTIGLGEPSNGTVPDDVAKQDLIRLISKIRSPINYIFFVINSKSKYLPDDARVYNIIKHIFDGAISNIVLVLTNADDDYLVDNKDYLQERYGKLEMIAVNFPSVHNNPKQEEIYKEYRTQDYKKLMNWLNKLDYKAIKPKICYMTPIDVATSAGQIIAYMMLIPFVAAAGVAVAAVSIPTLTVLIPCMLALKGPKESKEIIQNNLVLLASKLSNINIPSLEKNRVSKVSCATKGCEVNDLSYCGPDIITLTKPCNENLEIHEYKSARDDVDNCITWSLALLPWIETINTSDVQGTEAEVRQVVEIKYKESIESALPNVNATIGFACGVSAGVNVNSGAIMKVVRLKDSHKRDIYEQLNSKKISIKHSSKWGDGDIRSLLSFIVLESYRNEMKNELVIYNRKAQILHVYKQCYDNEDLPLELVFIASNVDPEYFRSDNERGYIIYDKECEYKIKRTGSNEDVEMVCDLDSVPSNIYSRECWKWAMTNSLPPNKNGIITEWEFSNYKRNSLMTTPAIILGMFACKYKQLYPLLATWSLESEINGISIPTLHLAPVRTMMRHDASNLDNASVRVIVGKGGTIATRKVVIG